jgi:hypothetical protein
LGLVSIGWTPVPLKIAIGFLLGTMISLITSYGMSQWPFRACKLDQVGTVLLLGVWMYWAKVLGATRSDPDQIPPQWARRIAKSRSLKTSQLTARKSIQA